MRFRWLLVTVAVLVAIAMAAPLAASPQQRFDDVDDTNIFFADIDWMAETGVTSGCSANPPLFCPDDFVTREQMSAFMHRLAAKRVVDADSVDGIDSSAFIQTGQKVSDADKLDGKDSTAFIQTGQKVSDADKLDGKDSTAFIQTGQTVGDADKLDGRHATQLGSRAAYAVTDDAEDASGILLTATVTAPAAGMLITGGAVDLTASAGEETAICGLGMGGTFIEGTVMFVTVNGTDPGPNEAACVTTGATVVPAGTVSVDLVIDTMAGGIGTLHLYDANVWVQWVPFDGSGATPTGTPSLTRPIDAVPAK